MVHPIVLQNVELQSIELQNVELQNAKLQNAELQNVEIQNVESYITSKYKMSTIQNVENYRLGWLMYLEIIYFSLQCDCSGQKMPDS